MGSHVTRDPERAVTKIYNSAIAAAAIAAAWEVGLLDAIREQGKVEVPKFAEKHGLDSDSLLSAAIALQVANVLEYKPHSVTPGELFDEAYRTRSFFHWLTLGSGGLFSRMQYVLRTENRTGDYHNRDPAAIAYACRQLSRQFFDPVFWAVMGGLEVEFRSVVDLGCGSGERLMQILDRYPGTTALGIDVAGPAVKFAESEAQKRGFGDRLSFVVGDARNLTARDEFGQIELLTCFMMGHDFWPRENCIRTLRTLREVFPKIRRFILGDATRALVPSFGSEPRVAKVTEDNVPCFQLGLEFGHVLMNTYIPTMQEWYDVFVDGGWRCVKGHNLPYFTYGIIFELAPLDE